MGQPDNPRAAWLLQAHDLSFRHGDHPVLGPLNFSVGPGLTWACGGDGRGKTTPSAAARVSWRQPHNPD